MHGALLERNPVLSLAPDSIASLGELDATSLSDLWGGMFPFPPPAPPPAS